MDKSIDEITLIIPTFNRCSCLFRILDYYRLHAPGIKIFIGDSSSDKNKEINRRNILSFSNSRIFQFTYPSDIVGILKMQDLLNQVNTKYCVFCADDDFITINGIEQAVNFLEMNPDYVAARGYEVAYHFVADANGNPVLQVKSCHDSVNQSIVLPDAQSRLHFHFTAYYPTFYAVHQTDFQIMILEEAAKYTSDPRFDELILSMTTAIYGKIKVLDLLYTAREIHLSSNSKACISPGLNTFKEDGTFDDKYRKFKARLIKHLMINSDLTIERAGRVIDNAFNTYYDIHYKKNKELKLIYEKIHRQLPEYKPKDLFVDRLKDPSSKEHNDLKAICHCILHHSQKVRNFAGKINQFIPNTGISTLTQATVSLV
jgi:glycosyltransferase domain-containing protein